MSPGKVYLVGAGPGDPRLLTLRGRDCLARADVVIHDDLVDARCLRFARAGAEIVSSGKKGDASRRDEQQREIHRRMIAAARAGKTVVRLKGGDPFVFGRGGEEASALVGAGVAFEVVPGVSAALAAPAYAGIPLTERGLNSSFTVVTGHEAEGTAHPTDWDAVARMETIVVLMGLRELREILARLVRAGKDPATPAVCIRAGTRPNQRVVVGTLGDLADRVARARLAPPATIVVGEVVRLRSTIRWFEKRPLLGRTILVTRPLPEAEALVERLEDLGAYALAAPAIEIRPVDGSDAEAAAFGALGSFDWIVFTSRSGVDVFFERLRALGRDLREIGDARLAAIGPATAEGLRARGLRVDLVPASYQAEGLRDALVPVAAGARFLLPRAGGARSVLPEALRQAGAEVVDLETYRAVSPAALPADAARAIREHRVDCVTFTSSSTVRHFVALAGDDGRAALSAAVVASIGPVTSQTVRDLGLRVDVEAREPTTDALVEAIVARFASAGPPPDDADFSGPFR